MEDTIKKIYKVEFEHRKWLNLLQYVSNEMNFYKERISMVMDDESNPVKKEELLELLKQLLEQKKTVLEVIKKINEHDYQMATLRNANGALDAMLNTHHSETTEEVANIRENYRNLKSRMDSKVLTS